VSAWQRRHLLASNERAPELRLLGLDGREHGLGDVRGKGVLLHFWATWCGVCGMEFSGLNSLHQNLPPGTVLWSVVADGTDRAQIERFVREHDIRYPVLLADEATIERFRVSSFPTNYYLDANGNLEQATVGMSTRAAMWLRLWFAR
jgi:peroxiredoxin